MIQTILPSHIYIQPKDSFIYFFFPHSCFDTIFKDQSYECWATQLFIWSPVAALWKPLLPTYTHLRFLLTSQWCAWLPDSVLGFQILKQLVDVCAFREVAKLGACRCKSITPRTKVAAWNAQWDPLLHAPPPRKTSFSLHSACLSNPIWLGKMLLNPPHFFFFFSNSTGLCGSKML